MNEESHEAELMNWLHEARSIFPKLDKSVIFCYYKPMSTKKLGYVRGKVIYINDFDAEALLLGKETKIAKKIIKPAEYEIFVNSKLQKIRNPLLRKQVAHTIIIHELYHIEQDDLITKSKDYSKRKKKKIHTHNFLEEVFDRYNQLREIKGLPKISNIKHLEEAIHKILGSIGWND
ncbi:MAG: hypothetical protein COV47_01340 [Candidatus Diapherotrites archaeon CG11_big_fil_rev_8_21_14_0_20_37_9]|nr:MAG: hypothetical protein COV47_01340 [Candidatus Diapherotrites archaeon CG11_big_fil_rev_8_21_14_0_20_37_9]